MEAAQPPPITPPPLWGGGAGGQSLRSFSKVVDIPLREGGRGARFVSRFITTKNEHHTAHLQKESEGKIMKTETYKEIAGFGKTGGFMLFKKVV